MGLFPHVLCSGVLLLFGIYAVGYLGLCDARGLACLCTCSTWRGIVC